MINCKIQYNRIEKVILYEDGILIPPCLQEGIYSILHSAYQGTEVMIEETKRAVY